MVEVSAARRHGMSKHEKKGRRQNSHANDEQVKDNELLALIRQQMANLRSGPEATRPKDLEIPNPDDS